MISRRARCGSARSSYCSPSVSPLGAPGRPWWRRDRRRAPGPACRGGSQSAADLFRSRSTPGGRQPRRLVPVAISPDPDDHYQAEVVLLKAHVDVDPVRPHIDVAHVGRGPAAARRSSRSTVRSATQSPRHRPAPSPGTAPARARSARTTGPCMYGSRSTSVIVGLLRHHGDRIADRNPYAHRWPARPACH